jgi:hypothetical protein
LKRVINKLRAKPANSTMQLKIRTSDFARAALALLLGLTINSQTSAIAQGTAFTYQGRLNDGANPANGVYDLQFAIYDANTNGNQIGNALTNSATSVTNGLFTVVMDFGNIFTGGSNWLDIAVRTNAGSGFTALSPRQQLTAAPYAVFANTASNLNGTLAASQLTGTVAIDRLPATVALVNSNLNFTGINTFSTNVGIGTNNPQAPLQVVGATPLASPNNEGVINAIQTGGNQNAGAVYGLSMVPSGSGVIGRADVSGPAGTLPAGVWGRTLATNGAAIYAEAASATGTNYGIYAYAASPGGYAGYFIGGRNYFSGNVGVGAANPQAPLHIVGSNPYPHLKVAAAASAPFGAFLSLDATAIPGGKDYLIFSTGGTANEGQGNLVFQNHTDGKEILYLSSAGGVGIGAAPGALPLYVRDTRASGFPSVAVEADSTIGTWLRLLNDSVGGHNWNIISSGSANGEGPGRLLFNDQSVGITRMLISSNGNVGIGTTDPKALLHVQGDIMGNGKVLMGNGGTNYAASSTENLRIVRGSINGDGSIARGSGFTVVHNGPVGTGSFTITFTPAFSGTPSVTATAVNIIARAGGAISASSVTVSTVNFGGSAVDDSFSFIAVGPY